MRILAAIRPARRTVKGQSAFHEGVQQDAQCPRVGAAAVVWLAQEQLGGGVVFAAAAGGEEWGGRGRGDLAGETEVGEGYEREGVGLGVGQSGGGELGEGTVD